MRSGTSWKTWLVLILLLAALAGGVTLGGGGEWLWNKLLALHGMKPAHARTEAQGTSPPAATAGTARPQ